MIPTNASGSKISTTAVPSSFLDVAGGRESLLIDYEWGGTNLNDPDDGLMVKIWTLRYNRHTSELSVSAEGSPTTVLFSRPNITEVALAFDQNMNPFVAFVQAGVSKFWWYDPTLPGMRFEESLIATAITPRCSLDDKRSTQFGNSDILLCYVRAGNLYYRQQRDRYLTEYLLKTGVQALVDVGMNNKLRFQWLYKGGGLPVAPFLADVVLSLCRRAGVGQNNVDVTELYDTRVVGFPVSGTDGINKSIDALREIFLFDKSETDRKIYFPRRGREVTARIPYSDLVADEPSSLKQTLIQEADLARSVTVKHLDPAGGFATNSQTARRRSNLIKATKDRKVETEVVLEADQAMTSATVKLKIEYHEQYKFKFSTWLKYAIVVPGSVVEVEDKVGFWHRIRVTERNDSHPILEFDGVQDAGQDVYASFAVGHSLPPPTSTTPGLIGPTLVEIINSSPFRDQDDELGVYLGLCGELAGWGGADILVSTDGVTYMDAMRVQIPATIGELLTELEAEVRPEYPARQSFEVLTNFALESVSYESLMNNANRCVVGDETLQFQFALLLGMVGGKYHYRCSGLVRGRYNTKPEVWAVGTRFVMLDSSIVFMQAQQWMLGKELFIKAVSIGLTEDETTPMSYDYLEGLSQTEWPPSFVEAVRDGSDNVTVTWVERPRLGIEADPHHSKYFNGYKIKFSDAVEATVAKGVTTYTRNSTPAGVTVAVCGLNTITGDGDFSEDVPT